MGWKSNFQMWPPNFHFRNLRVEEYQILECLYEYTYITYVRVYARDAIFGMRYLLEEWPNLRNICHTSEHWQVV